MSGLPLLSGPPPILESTRADASGCRKCSKEFNFLLARPRKCNHCGYSYCNSCTDYQGLMPRTGNETGYDVTNVCAYCIEFLTITAGGRGHLKSLPLTKLKKYINAYNIKADRAVEKDDLIDAIVAAKGANGCLPPANENYYRKYSVPDRSNLSRARGIFSRQSNVPAEPPLPPRPNQTPTYEFPRPDLEPDDPPPPPPRYAPPPGPPPRSPNAAPPRPSSQPHASPPPRPASSRPAPTGQYYNPHDQYHSQAHFNSHLGGHPPRHTPPPAAPRTTRPQQPNPGPYQSPRPSRSSHNLNANNDRTPPRARAASAAPPPTIPPPTLDQLLAMSADSLSSLSVHALKGILFTNHVNPGQVLEKSDLVKKVRDLVDEERRQRERQRRAEELEEQARIEQQRELMEQFTRTQKEKEDREKAAAQAVSGEDSAEGSSSSAPPPLPPKAQAMASHLERTGLCVICQDEEANIAIVDCGHLAMCRGCSDLVMGSSRECPLCRTRIVTEARLLRIFKT
ncbi:hypothetical protein DFH07DRAFT_859547 [Mycena maculata]|uniref:RING-type domain-containing protein n=1 Tax=Mycena maculata TaxID=230809 RepID=A0AAD7HFL8_9AGAR|nr:hypothetical protein DFH07DRAFT_859547 [Mycena maculata]